MAWIESHQELWRHPKTKKLARLLGVSVPTAVGHLHGLWYWALDFAQDGDLTKYDPEEIADAVLWEGGASDLMEALIAAEYIDQDGDNISLHDWHDYAGRLIEQRELQREANRERQRRYREKKNNVTPPSRVSNAGVTECNAPTVPNPTNPTKPNITNTTPYSPDGDDGDIKEKFQELQERRFTEFWQAYPKKVGKQAALKSWKRIKTTAELHDRIMKAIEAAKKTDQWQREAGRFIPNPSTWLNQGRWDDEIEEASARSAGVNQQHDGQGDGSFSLSGFKIAADE